MKRLKNSIFNVGSAVTSLGNVNSRHSGDGPRPSSSGYYETEAAAAGWRSPPTNPYDPPADPSMRYPPQYYNSVTKTQENGMLRNIDDGVRSAWAKMKGILGRQNHFDEQIASRPYGHYSYDAAPTYQSQQTTSRDGNYAPGQLGDARTPGGSQAFDKSGNWPPPYPSTGQYSRAERSEPGYEGYQGRQGNMLQSKDKPSADFVSSPLQDLNSAQKGAFDSKSLGYSAYKDGNHGSSAENHELAATYPGSSDIGSSHHSSSAETEMKVAPEPQIFVSDGSIVLIPRPVEFFRKKKEIIDAGSHQLHVFADFERTMTNFRAPNGGEICLVLSTQHSRFNANVFYIDLQSFLIQRWNFWKLLMHYFRKLPRRFVV